MTDRARAIQELDKKIKHEEDLKKSALHRHDAKQAKVHEGRAHKLRASRERLLHPPKAGKHPVKGKPPGWEDPTKFDSYAKVKITRKNAGMMAAYYFRRTYDPLTKVTRRPYFQKRLREAQRLKAAKHDRKAGTLRARAVEARKRAERARQLRNYPTAERYDKSAARLEQEAVTAQSRESEAEEAPDRPDRPEARPGRSGRPGMRDQAFRDEGRRPRGGDAPQDRETPDDGASMTVSADVSASVEPFWKRPWVWIGAVAIGAVVIYLRKSGHGASTFLVLGGSRSSHSTFAPHASARPRNRVVIKAGAVP